MEAKRTPGPWMKLWNDMTVDEQMGVTLGLLALAVAGALAGLFFWAEYQEHQDRAEWEAFSAAHDCRKTHSESSHVGLSTGVGFSASGKSGLVTGPTYIPARVGYTCDDGVTYWRSN